VHLAERRPLCRVAVPTLHHQVVDLTRTVARLTEHDPLEAAVWRVVLVVAARTVVDDPVVRQRFERTFTGERQYLPQCHRE